MSEYSDVTNIRSRPKLGMDQLEKATLEYFVARGSKLISRAAKPDDRPGLGIAILPRRQGWFGVAHEEFARDELAQALHRRLRTATNWSGFDDDSMTEFVIRHGEPLPPRRGWSLV